MNTSTDKSAPPGLSADALRARIAEAYARQDRQAAEERWILETIPLVRHLARRVASTVSRHADLEDLISAGTVGLVKAARSYDPDRDAEFRTYAYIRIRGAIIDELRSRSFVPATVHARYRNVQEAYRRLTGRNGAPPDDAELAREAGLTRDELYRVLQEARARQFLSIHGLAGDDEGGPEPLVPPDREPGPDEQAERKELLARLAAAIRDLPDRERKVILLYYERDLNMKEIAAVLEVSEPRISQIHAAALFRLSMKLRDDDGR